MTGRWTILTVAALGLLMTAEPAQASGGRWWSSSYGSPVVVYYPVVVRAYPVVWVCQPPISTPTVIPLVPQIPAAQPIPAPPSRRGETKEPPLGSASQKAPTIIETRSSGTTKEEPAKDKAKVGFWNVTGKDITLKIDGQPRVLPRDRAITVELPRNFVWQVDLREPTSERVPAEDSFFEVIIRK